MTFYDRLLAETGEARARFLSIPILQRALVGDIARDDYLCFLGQAYHHVRHTVPLLMGCGYRLDDDHAWLRPALARYIEEETGHEAWILDDIAACGGEREAAAAAAPIAATELMVAYAYDVIARGNPLGFFGMVLVLEGTSVALATQAAQAIRERLQLPENGFRYLTSHGTLDRSHMQFFADLMNRVTDADDQRAVIHCADMFYRLYGDIFRAIAERSQTPR